MKTKYLSDSIKAVVLVTALSYGASASLRAVTAPSAQPLSGVASGQIQLETVDFKKDGPEAKMVAHVYAMLANGDHDYAGHRIAAMHHVELAGTLLGLDLAGDLKDHEKQVLSDDQMRQAKRLLKKLIKNAEIKDQPRVVDELTSAVHQIDSALATS